MVPRGRAQGRALHRVWLTGGINEVPRGFGMILLDALETGNLKFMS